MRTVSLLLAATLVAADPFKPNQIKSLVTFGDSYSDVQLTGDGGVAWPDYVVGYAKVDLYPFARAGATCSNLITPVPWPSVFESQLPAYFGEDKNFTAEDTVYTLWIGTNDVGSSSLITGSNSASIVDVTECAVNWVKVLNDNGARNFVIQNMIPLDTLPMYSANAYPNKYFHLDRNTTEWNVFMKELVLSGNRLSQYMLQELTLTRRNAKIGIFDSHSLFQDMYDNPAAYLNGTAPLNVTGSIMSCVYELNRDEGAICTEVMGTDRDSFLWYDELHPSEQADRIVAREISKVITGAHSKWMSWLSN